MQNEVNSTDLILGGILMYAMAFGALFIIWDDARKKERNGCNMALLAFGTLMGLTLICGTTYALATFFIK